MVDPAVIERANAAGWGDDAAEFQDRHEAPEREARQLAALEPRDAALVQAHLVREPPLTQPVRNTPPTHERAKLFLSQIL